MKANYTDINIVLDRSGSMATVQQDTIGGFNTFLAKQKAEAGEATLTLHQFDDQFETTFDNVAIADVPDLTNLTFVPRGWTALYDAIGMSIVKAGIRLGAMKEEDRPSKVIFVILTDGDENRSSEYDGIKINAMIKEQTDKYNWDFVFLGANQDAIKTGATLGIKGGMAMSYSSNVAGSAAVFDTISTKMSSYRSMVSSDTSLKSNFFDDNDRSAAIQ
jgi:hypothetical protein